MVRRLAVAAGLLLLMAPAGTGASEPFRYPEARCAGGELRYINGLPVLVVAGTPEQMGTAVGLLALRPGRQMLSYPEDVLRKFHAHLLWGTFLQAGNHMVQRFPDDYRQELEAMVQGAGVPRDPVVVGNTLFDLKKMIACSALLVDPAHGATGAPLMGRNLDYPSVGYAQEYSLVTVYRPGGGKHAFASVGFPGLVGCLSGMNDAGLCVAVLEVFQVQAGLRRLDSTGMPYALCYRRLLEDCSTIGEAHELLGKLHRTTITNLAVADRSGVAVFEVTPTQIRVRGAEDGTCVCTNHFCTPDLRPFVPLDTYRTKERFQALERASARQQELGLPQLQQALAEAAQPTETMQTMIFEPAALRLHLAIGMCPSTAAEMRILDLGPLLTGSL
jgi:predicted choloylglycine hydrolase